MFGPLENAMDELKHKTIEKNLTENMLIKIARELKAKVKAKLVKSTAASVYATFNTFVLQNYGKKWHDIVLKKVTHLPPKDKKNLEDKAMDRNEKRKDDKLIVDGNKYFEMINELKKSVKNYDEKKDFYKICACLLMSTGRRPIEILLLGKFTESEDQNHIMFEGQAKTRTGDERKAYEIPIIGITAKEVLHMFELVRQTDFSGLTKKQVSDNNRQAIINIVKSKLGITLDDVRSCWAYIAIKKYAGDKDKDIYGMKILGHKRGMIGTFIMNYKRVKVTNL